MALKAGSTLSADTKDALARDIPQAEHCRRALLDSLAFYGGREGVVRTQRSSIARLARTLAGSSGIRKIPGTRLYRAPVYEIDTPPALAKRPSARCDRRMEMRAAFLATGSLATPAHGYHLEFVMPDEVRAARLEKLFAAAELPPKRTQRKGRVVLYYKGLDAIVDILTSIGAFTTVLALEDVRAMKETKNRIRRLVNTEAANVDRAVSAGAMQREAIAAVADAIGLRNLAPAVREIATLRMQHPDESLAELGKRCKPPVGKATVNGRLSVIMRLARPYLAAPGDS